MKTKVREKPIIFDAKSVRAILAGTKTQTRRVVKPQPLAHEYVQLLRDNRLEVCPDGGFDCNVRHIHCPYPVGTRLWVREALRATHDITIADGEAMPIAAYAADGAHIWTKNKYRRPWACKGSTLSPVHMPKWAARLWLEVTSVRVERVQEISEADADAEGFGGDIPCNVFPDVFAGDCGHLSMPECFGVLWNSINANRGYPWESNPWVWVIEFKRVEAKQ